MVTFTSILRFLILPFLLVAWMSKGFTQPVPIEVNHELQLYRDSLDALETALGSTSPQLVETLEEIADRLMALDEHAEAQAVLNRAQQIIRINEGLYSVSQYRLLRKKIENLVNMRDWRNARKLQDHLFWLYTHKNTNFHENTVAELLKTSDLHLRGVVEDGAKYQSYHYHSAASHSRFALAIAQAIWQPHDPRYGQVIYEQLKHSYLQALAVQKTSLNLNRDVVRTIHRGIGYLYLEQLRQLHLDHETPDLEAAAMTTLYRADWQVLFQQRELAVASYAEAYSELLEAGVPVQLVDELFVEPSLIPEPVFYAKVSAALANRKKRTQFTLLPLRDGFIRVTFDDWSELTSPSGKNDGGLGNVFTDPVIALFSFSLAGVEQIERGRWPNRRRSAFGASHDLKLLEAKTTTDLQLDTLIEELNWSTLTVQEESQEQKD